MYSAVESRFQYKVLVRKAAFFELYESYLLSPCLDTLNTWRRENSNFVFVLCWIFSVSRYGDNKYDLYGSKNAAYLTNMLYWNLDSPKEYKPLFGYEIMSCLDSWDHKISKMSRYITLSQNILSERTQELTVQEKVMRVSSSDE